MEQEQQICQHCGGEIKIRNPTGTCDHLYYPENNCQGCKEIRAQEALENEEGRLQIVARDALGMNGYVILANRIAREARKQINLEEQELYAKAWQKWSELQYLMVFEEFAELQKELVKQLRGKGDSEHIQEEIADCLIMLEQLMVKHGRTFILEKKAEKIQRLKKLLG